MYIALLIKHWKSILIICCFIIIAFLSTLCVIQHKEISTHVQNIKNVNVEWELKFKQLNNEGIALQREYDLLEQQHKTKVEALNEKVRQQQAESTRAYNELTVSNDKLHKTLRDSTAKLSNLSREANIDYSQRASRLLAECSSRYINMAKTARDLGIDRDALDEAYPSKKGD